MVTREPLLGKEPKVSRSNMVISLRVFTHDARPKNHCSRSEWFHKARQSATRTPRWTNLWIANYQGQNILEKWLTRQSTKPLERAYHLKHPSSLKSSTTSLAEKCFFRDAKVTGQTERVFLRSKTVPLTMEAVFRNRWPWIRGTWLMVRKVSRDRFIHPQH